MLETPEPFGPVIVRFVDGFTVASVAPLEPKLKVTFPVLESTFAGSGSGRETLYDQ